MSAKPSCADCTFWERWGSERGGCHRLPPSTDFEVSGREVSYQRVQVTITKSHNPIWPNTAQDDWCGEFTPSSAKATGETP